MDVRNCRHTLTPQVHVTLLFLGDTSGSAVEGIVGELSRVCARTQPMALRCTRIASMPASRPWLLAAMFDPCPALDSFQEHLVASLPETEGGNDHKRFTAHATLCRFRRGVRTRRVDAAIDGGSFEIREIRLVRSHLGPAGATHEVVATMALGDPGGGGIAVD